MWKVLLKTQNLIRKGMCFRISDEMEINWWTNLWVLGLRNMRLEVNERVVMATIMRVVELRLPKS